MLCTHYSYRSTGEFESSPAVIINSQPQAYEAPSKVMPQEQLKNMCTDAVEDEDHQYEIVNVVKTKKADKDDIDLNQCVAYAHAKNEDEGLYEIVASYDVRNLL